MQNNIDKVTDRNIEKFEEFGEIINDNRTKINKMRNQYSNA